MSKLIDFPHDPRIYFSRDRSHALQMSPGTIVICAQQADWNDFGHQTLFEFTLVLSQGEIMWKPLRLGFIGGANSDHSEASLVREIFSRGSNDIRSTDDFPSFFTLQHNAAAYGNLVNEIGARNASNVLVALNDLVIIERFPNQPEWLEGALRSDVFNYSFIRSVDGFSAYFEGYNTFHGRVPKFSYVLPSKLMLSFRLDSFHNSHEFNFSFEPGHFLPKRMAAIIGKNGVGKSRALNMLVHALLEQTSNLTDESHQLPNISKLIAVCTPGETESTFPHSSTFSSAIPYIRLSPISSEKIAAHNETLPRILQKLARRDVHEHSYRWSIFERSIRFVIKLEELCIIPATRTAYQQENEENPVSDVMFLELSNGTETSRLEAMKRLDQNGSLARTLHGRNYPLSSGQISFIRLAAQLCLHIDPGTLVLIDEPETHLHPHLITQFVVMLNSVLEITNSIAIVATHSAYFVREVPTTQVHVITQSSSGFIHIGVPRLKTFGSDVGAISDFIFEDDAVSSLVKETAFRISENHYMSEHWQDELRMDLSTEAIMYIKRSEKNSVDGGE